MDGRTKLIVLDEHTLGCQRPHSNFVGILGISVLKGSPYSYLSLAYAPLHNVRLASEDDFKKFGVVFDGYKNNKEQYEYEET